MNIEISEEQFYRLLKLVYLGNLMVNDFRMGGKDPRLEEYDEIEGLLFKLAHEKGDKEIVRFDVKTQKYFPSAAFEYDEEIDSHIEKYIEDVFWDELASRLAERDTEEELGEEVMSRLDDAEARRVLDEAEEKYFEEFNENGLDNLRLVPALAPGSRIH